MTCAGVTIFRLRYLQTHTIHNITAMLR